MATIVNPVQVQKFLKGVDYPCSKAELMKAAEEGGADQNVLETLKQIPMERFNSSNDVAQGIAQIEKKSKDEDMDEGEYM